ncbi:MAG: Fic family protein [Methylohalobius sp. ZOD2]
MKNQSLDLGFEPFPFEIQVSHVGVQKACFHARRMLPSLIYDAVALEGNPYTFIEVLTLLDGITVGGRRLSHQQQILNLLDGWNALIEEVFEGRFHLSKETYCCYHALIANGEARKPGVFRGGLVGVFGSSYQPPAGDHLNAIFDAGLSTIKIMDCPFNAGIHFFLFGALHKFFYAGNRRVSALMMNGILMSHGHLPITIPAARRREYIDVMMGFYETRNAEKAVRFLLDCAQDPGGPEAFEGLRHDRRH